MLILLDEKKKSLQVYTFSLYACFVEQYKKNIINPTMSIPFWHLKFFFPIYIVIVE